MPSPVVILSTFQNPCLLTPHPISSPLISIPSSFGLAVTGTVHPERFIRNVGVASGDYLILTKPLGTGVLTSALKRNASMCPASTKQAGLAWMQMLNRSACEAVSDDEHRGSVTAMTDVTGFGFLGHLMKMVRGDASDKPTIVSSPDHLVANVCDFILIC